MAVAELKQEGAIAYREALPEGPEGGPPVVCVHGFPESSRMWAPLIEALAESGRRGLAPDLYGLGDSTDFGPATFENSLTAAERNMLALGEHQRVRETRTLLQHANEHDFVQTIEQITGRRVGAFVSGTDTEHDVSSEVFYLHPKITSPDGA